MNDEIAPVRHILFICEGNIHRSRTAADFYARTPGLQTRSAGLADSARVQVCDELLEWTDAIFVMEDGLAAIVRHRFRAAAGDKGLVSLGIPDEYQYMQPELLAILAERLAPHLGSPGGSSGL